MPPKKRKRTKARSGARVTPHAAPQPREEPTRKDEETPRQRRILAREERPVEEARAWIEEEERAAQAEERAWRKRGGTLLRRERHGSKGRASPPDRTTEDRPRRPDHVLLQEAVERADRERRALRRGSRKTLLQRYHALAVEMLGSLRFLAVVLGIGGRGPTRQKGAPPRALGPKVNPVGWDDARAHVEGLRRRLAEMKSLEERCGGVRVHRPPREAGKGKTLGRYRGDATHALIRAAAEALVAAWDRHGEEPEELARCLRQLPRPRERPRSADRRERSLGERFGLGMWGRVTAALREEGPRLAVGPALSAKEGEVLDHLAHHHPQALQQRDLHRERQPGLPPGTPPPRDTDLGRILERLRALGLARRLRESRWAATARGRAWARGS